jgi:hypothetical protein
LCKLIHDFASTGVTSYCLIRLVGTTSLLAYATEGWK